MIDPLHSSCVCVCSLSGSPRGEWSHPFEPIGIFASRTLVLNPKIGL